MRRCSTATGSQWVVNLIDAYPDEETDHEDLRR